MQYRKLCTFLKESTLKVDIDNATEYKCGGVRLNGRGVFVREIKLGADIQKQWVMHRIESGNVVYSTLFADKGAFAIAKTEDEELVFSEKFVCFKITDNSILPEYLDVIFQTDYLSKQCNEFKTGMAAFSLSHSSKKKVLQLSIPVPSVEDQMTIIAEYQAFKQQRIRLYEELQTLLDNLNLMKDKFLHDCFQSVDTVPLHDIGEYVRRPIDIEPGIEYKQITVRVRGNGMVLRKVEDGGNIKSKQYIVKENDLVYSKIDIKSGAIAFVPPELDDGIVTADFPVIRLKEINEVNKGFLMMYFSCTLFYDYMEDKSKGTTNRVRAKKSSFLNTTVPWGDYVYREKMVIKYNNLCEELQRMSEYALKLQEEIPLITSKYLNKLLGID